jgi:hypothetical protein
MLLLEINSGYSREDILGSNCRFLNGPGTSMEVLEEVSISTVVAFNCMTVGLSFCSPLSILT